MNKAREGSTLARAQRRAAWLFLAPGLLALAAVGLYPLLDTFRLSFTDAFRGDPDPARWVGFAHYRALLADGAFREAVRNTVVFATASVALEFLLGLGIALLLAREFRGRAFMRTAMLIPWALPTVVAARLWAWMFNDVFGVVNDLLHTRLGLLPEPLAWTATPGLAMAAIIAVDVWKTTPFMALLLLAGLQLIPRELYEAARVDGASRWQQFRAVTLPLLKPAILVALIFRTLDALRVFDVIWVMTAGKFGTESLATYTYRQTMAFNRLGYGAAASVLVFLIIALFTAAYVTVLRVDRDR
ncbi:MAG: sugar ABC transporter permease [Candidatus Sumerlaeia bacterium]|nr:sugar ABC transporter permease [Candidatus Sumerlaeia bacterium]